MQKINTILQFLLRIFLIFLFIFVWVKYFTRRFLPAFFISLFSALLIDLIIRIFTNKKNGRELLKLKEKEDCENMFFSLACEKKELAFFYKLASKRHECSKTKDYVIIKHDDGDVILYPFFSFSQLKIEDINQILYKTRRKSHKKLVITCGEIDKECFHFIKNFETPIVLLNKFDTYNKLYKEYNYFPKITKTYVKNKKTTFKELLSYSFNKSRTKSYIFSAFVLLFSSIFVRMNLYYCIISSLLIIFAIISFINPFYKTKTNTFEL